MHRQSKLRLSMSVSASLVIFSASSLANEAPHSLNNAQAAAQRCENTLAQLVRLTDGFWTTWADYNFGETPIGDSYPEIRDDIVLVQSKSPSDKSFSSAYKHHQFFGMWPIQTADKELNRATLKTIYKSYEKSISGELIKKTEAIESELPQNRLTYLLIENASKEKPLGFVRLFDGNPYHSHTNSKLPLERIIEARGGQVPSALTALKKKVIDTQEATIIEIGKLYVAPGTSDRSRVRNAVTTWIRAYAEGNPGSVFFAHVATEAHKTIYQRAGFQVLSAVSMPDTHGNEYILYAPAEDLGRSLKPNKN